MKMKGVHCQISARSTPASAVEAVAIVAIDDEGLCASATGIELLLSRADTAMRQAKRSGRDRSVRHGQPVAA